MSRILVPVDFSPHSELALRYATALAARLGALVEVVHVVEEPMGAGAWGSETPSLDLPQLREHLIAEAGRQLDQYRPIAEVSHVRTVTTVRMGQPAHTIAAYANAAGIDLIVMGTHGRSGPSRLPIGSVAERVVRSAPCPVLTLRDRGTYEATESVAVAVAERATLGSVLGHHGTSRE